MGFLDEVLCEAGCVAVVAESYFMFIVACGELSSSPSNIRLIAVWAYKFIYLRQGEFVLGDDVCGCVGCLRCWWSGMIS